MKGRVYRLTEFLQKVEQRLELEERRQRPNVLILLHLRTLRLRIKNAMKRALGRWINPHRKQRAAQVLRALRTA